MEKKETGVTTFKLQHDIDTGNILLQDRFPIGEKDTAGIVHDTMKEVGARLLVKTVAGIQNGTLKEVPQDEWTKEGNSAAPTQLKHAPKIFTETCNIQWERPVAEIYDLIRGLSPFPAAFTQLDGKLLKIFSSEKQVIPPKHTAGQYESDGKTYLKFAGSDGYILVKEIQLEGKKRMSVEDFLRGYRLLS